MTANNALLRGAKRTGGVGLGDTRARMAFGVFHSLVALLPCVCRLEDGVGVRPGADVVGVQGVKNHLKQVFEPSRGVMVVNASVTHHFGKVQQRGGLNSLPAPVRAGEDGAEDDDALQQPPGLQDQDAQHGPQDCCAGQSEARPLADRCADYGETPQTVPRVNGGGDKSDESSGSQAPSPFAPSALRKRLRESINSNEPDGEIEKDARRGSRAPHPVGVLGKGEEEEEEEEEAGDKKGQDMLGKGRDGGARAGKVGKVGVAPKARAAADQNTSNARHVSILNFVKGDAQRGSAAGCAPENSVAQDEEDDMQVVQVDDEEEEPSMANGNERKRSRARRKDSGVAAQMEMKSDDDVQAADGRMARNASLRDQDQQTSQGKVFPTRRGRQADGDDDADNADEGRAFLSKPRHAGKQHSCDQEQVTGKAQELSQGNGLATAVLIDVDAPVASGGVSTSVDAGYLPSFTHLLCACVHPCTWYVGTHACVAANPAGKVFGKRFVQGLNGASCLRFQTGRWCLKICER